MAGRWLDRTETVYLASLASLALGLFFTFVWAPHPWGWQGIDQYHELALQLARGEPFGTTDVPWGYAYFAAAFYWLFGPHVWVPVLVQVIVNAAAPLLLYRLIRPWTTQRHAVLASVITGLLSFNNVYASTQASDALCTILFLASLLALARAIVTERPVLFAVAGLLAGIVPQFRPNMVLLPALVAAGYVLLHRGLRPFRNAVIYSAMVTAALAPWIIRNYQLTGLFLPTSTHGGVQLWYGTLQVRPYLESRAHNPRSIFESPSFHYTSLADTPIGVEVQNRSCPVWADTAFSIHYWTDRDATLRSATPSAVGADRVTFSIPGQPLSTAVYYFFEARWRDGQGEHVQATPAAGRSTPFVFFVADDHLGDLDRHNDIVDVFDLIRAVTATTVVDSAMQQLAQSLLPSTSAADPIASIVREPQHTRVVFADDSSWTIPMPFSGRLTDLEVNGNLAGALLSARGHTRARDVEAPGAPAAQCRLSDTPRVNDVFYRREPHMMRRYLALASDNIARDRAGFIAASLYRAVRLFIIRGTSDVKTAQQFSASQLAYAAGTVLSATYFIVFLTGAWLAWRQRSALLWLLVPIVYVPLTICFVLTNMRYTVTMQPLMFVFVALTLLKVLRLDPQDGGRQAGRTGAES